VSSLFVLIFIVFVLVAIGLHEFGHFATAKAFGIRVDKFFIGFGPKIWSTRRGDTEYGVSAFPIGGYVKIAGMSPLDDIPESDRARTFKSKPAWQRAIVLAAGSVTHFIVGLIILAAILAIHGEQDPNRPTLVVGSVGQSEPGKSPSQIVGLMPGDRVISVDGVVLKDWRELVTMVRARPNETLDLVIERNGTRLTLQPILQTKKDPATHQDVVDQTTGKPVGFLGVSPEYTVIHRSFFPAIGRATEGIGIGMKESILALKKVFAPSTLKHLFQVATGSSQRSAEDPATIVGIGRASADLAKHGDWAQLFMNIAVFNVFVGVVNLLPLPPLDGGHLAVLGYEKARRRDVDVRRLIPITAMVLTIFGSLFFLLLYLDIVKPLPSIPG
jgi:membrane-associated protease RseP (regulator of RpoE activity)